ncbi:MAG: hypothetical protein AABX53_00975 [Nanoarchaeota archaeon]
MFGKKQDCPKCHSTIKADFDFCPHCGCDVRNPEKDLDEFGLLGKNEFSQAPLIGGGGAGFGFSDKIIASLFNQIMRSLESQMKGASHADMASLPNGIQVSIGTPAPKQPRTRSRKLTDEQMKRMAGVPRIEAKSDIRRLSDGVVYDLRAPGIGSIDDVFVSKVESGYEIKAIGKNKVYVNSLQVDLPLKRYSLHEKGLTLEFGA